MTQKGIRETPPGSNRNMYSAYFGFGPQFWCADFVGFCLDKTGNEDKKVPWGYPSAVENITRWGQSNNFIHDQPKKGDIFTRKDGKHTGFVLTAQGSSFMTIEGNTMGPSGCVYVASHARDASSGHVLLRTPQLLDDRVSGLLEASRVPLWLVAEALIVKAARDEGIRLDQLEAEAAGREAVLSESEMARRVFGSAIERWRDRAASWTRLSFTMQHQ